MPAPEPPVIPVACQLCDATDQPLRGDAPIRRCCDTAACFARFTRAREARRAQEPLPLMPVPPEPAVPGVGEPPRPAPGAAPEETVVLPAYGHPYGEDDCGDGAGMEMP